MSVEAITWAFKQDIKSSAKFVLVALANLADNNGICYPSVKYIICATNQDRKTVMKGIKELIDLGFVVDTGDRAGKTKSIPVYKLLVSSTKNGTVKQYQNRDSIAVPKMVQFEGEVVPNFPISSTKFPYKQYQIWDTDTKYTQKDTKKEKNIKKEKKPIQKKQKQAAEKSPEEKLLIEHGVDEQTISDWYKHRKAQKASITLTVIKQHINQAQKAGISLNEALSISCSQGWRGFNANWINPKENSRKQSSQKSIFE